MKVFFLLIIVLLSSLIGYLYGEGFRNRLSQLRELKRALIDFESDIVYTYTPLPESIESIALKAKSPIKELFNEISFKLKNNEVENAIKDIRRSIQLDDFFIDYSKKDKELSEIWDEI